MDAKKNILYCFCFSLLVLFFTSTGLLAQPSQKRIIFTCPLLFNGIDASVNDSLVVEGYSTDSSSYIFGATMCRSDSTVIYLTADSSINLLNVDFSFVFLQGTPACLSGKIIFSIDTARSNADTIYIDSFTISSYYAYYPIQNVCDNQFENMALETDLPAESFNIGFPDGIKTDSSNTVSPSQSAPGNYFFTITTEYCLNTNPDSLNFITITKSVNLALPDTIKRCATVSVPGNIFDGLSYEPLDTSLTVPGNSLLHEGYYLFSKDTSTGCYNTDTAFIKIIAPLETSFAQNETCDNVILSLNQTNGTAVETNWSNGSKSPIIEVTNSDVFFVELVDKYGCKTYDSVFVTFNPLEIEAVNYAVEEADCWKDGSVMLSDIKLNNSRGDYTSRLVNTLNGTSFDSMDAIPDGLYKLEVSDSRNCRKEYPEKITVVQKCLEDYPVFSPNQDGVEDEYFIPYEGTVKIYDKNGSLIKNLTTPAYWNGTNNSGSPLPMGNYVIITDKGKPVNITIVR